MNDTPALPIVPAPPATAAPALAAGAMPRPPVEPALNPTDKVTVLRARLITVLLGLPSFFEFNNHVADVEATDLHALNTLLGASIEGQVVRTLNQQRALWDPDDEWLGYQFVRQSQKFPDVLLARKGGEDGPDIALGIELKGWFLLAKEGVPSFRFQTTPDACADHDLLVVVPWYLDNVLSGSPVAAEPWVKSARWVAEYRNFWWTHVRKSKSDKGINAPAGAQPYPTADSRIQDVPVYDGGDNFGRLARVTGLMAEFVESTNRLEALGIPIVDWFLFLRAHSSGADPTEVTAELLAGLIKSRRGLAAEQASRVLAAVREIADALAD